MMKMSGAVFGQMRRKRMTMPSRQGEKSGLPEFDSESGGGEGGGLPQIPIGFHTLGRLAWTILSFSRGTKKYFKSKKR